MFHWTIHLEGEHRRGQAAVVVGHQIYCFGGDRDQRERDHIEVHVFNTVSSRWRKLTPALLPGTGERHLEVPSRRRGHTAVLIEYTVYLWGGYPYCNVLHAFDVDAHRWFKPQVSGTVPEERMFHSACVVGEIVFIHGGCTRLTGWTNNIYTLDSTTMLWTLINTGGTPPPASSRHSASIIGTTMFVFGGCGGWHYTTIRVFDTETNHWLDTPPSTQIPPIERRDHSAFSYNGELYIFGGKGRSEGNLNDVWKFTPETFSWKKVEPKGKGPRPVTCIRCCMVGDRIILFGADNRPGDLYVLDFSPSLKTLCKLSVIQYGLEQSELPHDIRWELAAMTTGNRS